MLLVTAEGARLPQRTDSTQIPPFAPETITACRFTAHVAVSLSPLRRIAIWR